MCLYFRFFRSCNWYRLIYEHSFGEVTRDAKNPSHWGTWLKKMFLCTLKCNCCIRRRFIWRVASKVPCRWKRCAWAGRLRIFHHRLVPSTILSVLWVIMHFKFLVPSSCSLVYHWVKHEGTSLHFRKIVTYTRPTFQTYKFENPLFLLSKRCEGLVRLSKQMLYNSMSTVQITCNLLRFSGWRKISDWTKLNCRFL